MGNDHFQGSAHLLNLRPFRTMRGYILTQWKIAKCSREKMEIMELLTPCCIHGAWDEDNNEFIRIEAQIQSR
jgi:hypothetical protein